jgi:regulator of sigma E protease
MSVSGPVGLYVVVDYLRDLGFWPLLGITADISLSIGIINLLPIPALDGGRAVMISIEWITRKPLNKKFEAWAIQISFILLLLLMVAVLFKDVLYFEKLKEFFN